MNKLIAKAILMALILGLLGGYGLTWLGQLLTSVLKTDVRTFPTAVLAVFILVLLVIVIREAMKLLATFGGGNQNNPGG